MTHWKKIFNYISSSSGKRQLALDDVDLYLEDSEHGKPDVVEGSDASVGAGPLLQAHRDVRVADVGAPTIMQGD